MSECNCQMKGDEPRRPSRHAESCALRTDAPGGGGMTEEEYLRFREWARMNSCGVAKFDAEVMTLLLDTIDAARADLARVTGERDAGEFWRGCFKDGADSEQVRRELTDYHFMLKEVPKVYDHISDGMLSKPNYHAAGVIQRADEVLAERVEEAVKDETEELSIRATRAEAERDAALKERDELREAADAEAEAADEARVRVKVLEGALRELAAGSPTRPWPHQAGCDCAWCLVRGKARAALSKREEGK